MNVISMLFRLVFNKISIAIIVSIIVLLVANTEKKPVEYEYFLLSMDYSGDGDEIDQLFIMGRITSEKGWQFLADLLERDATTNGVRLH